MPPHLDGLLQVSDLLCSLFGIAKRPFPDWGGDESAVAAFWKVFEPVNNLTQAGNTDGYRPTKQRGP